MKNVKFIIWFIAVILLTSITYVSLFSKNTNNDKIAKVTFVKGTVYWYKQNSQKKIKAKIGTILPENSVVETMKKSSAVIYLKNNIGTINLDENSKILLSKSYINKTQNNLSVIKGKAKFSIKKLMKNNNLNVYTPTAVVGVRGTEYEVQIAEDGSTAVNVEEGLVDVDNKSKSTKIAANQSCESPLDSDELVMNEKLLDLDKWDDEKANDVNQNPVSKMESIKSRLDETEKEQKQINKDLKNDENDENKIAGKVDDFMFNQAKSEGLYESATAIAKKHKKNKKVKENFYTIIQIHSRMQRLNQLIEDKFNKLDKIYEEHSNKLEKKLEEKEKMFDEKFKDFDNDK